MLQIRPEASHTRMIPTYHPYIKNYLDHQQDLKSETNTLRIAVETAKGDIFTKEYQEILKKMTDDVFFVSGVDRPALRSLWTPVVRWREITVDGIDGGPVIDADYDGSEKSLLELRKKVFKSGTIGSLVANDFKSSIIQVAIHDIDPETGKPLDYTKFSNKLEAIRSKYQNKDIHIHITGFAKLYGDLIEGETRVAVFFLIAFFVLLGHFIF